VSQLLDLTDRVVLVTGAGNGLGASHARLLGSLGAAVVVNDLGGARDGSGSATSAADAVVQEIVAAGGRAVANYDSVASQEGAQSMVAAALDAFGRLDAVVNNAGILRDRSLPKLTAEDIDLVLDVHLKGTIFVSQAAFPVMKAAGFGRFVHTASSSGVFGNFGQTNYAAAKAGIAGFSRALAEEGAKYDILSNVICPVARTRMTDELLGDLADLVAPERVSPLVAALLSPHCKISREMFSAAGGRYARVFSGLTTGWRSEDEVADASDVLANMKSILSTEEFTVPVNANEELAGLARLLTGSEAAGVALGAAR
jgi:NAD(P)-dependent dehydrogenase (short-subunit alcohol dehydrogenase family)